jgi:phospholipase D1/2
VFALRAYDRINRTPALEELEKKAGVNYQDIQRGIAESIMSESVHPAIGKEGDENEKSYEADSAQRQENLRKLEKFEEQVEQLKADEGDASRDSVAHTTMLNGGKMSDEIWEGDPEAEKTNIVQEELYVHGKVCIVDDRTIICGSANINDRVSGTPRLSSMSALLIQCSPNSAPTIANWPSSWKTKTSSTAR